MQALLYFFAALAGGTAPGEGLRGPAWLESCAPWLPVVDLLNFVFCFARLSSGAPMPLVVRGFAGHSVFFYATAAAFPLLRGERQGLMPGPKSFQPPC